MPLSDPAVAILNERRRLHREELVFASERTGRTLSQMGLTRTVQGIAGRIHGFRSSFRDSASEETALDFAVVGTAVISPCGQFRRRAGVPSQRPPREASRSDGRLGQLVVVGKTG